MRSLNLDGGGWRMPTMDELEGLYENRGSSRNITPLLKNTGWGVWSGEPEGSSYAKIFIFALGFRYWSTCRSSNKERAFAVRSQSGG